MTAGKIDRKRQELRDQLANRTGVLDLFTPRVGDPLTRDQLCELLDVTRDALSTAVRRHSDELRADGWDTEADTFSRRATIRIASIMRKSPRAVLIARAAEQGDNIIDFRHRSTRDINAVSSWAMGFAVDLRDNDPAEMWVRLRNLEDYTLRAVVVALAAMVDVERPALRWPADGLGSLIPTRKSADGVALAAIDQIVADAEAS